MSKPIHHPTQLAPSEQAAPAGPSEFRVDAPSEVLTLLRTLQAQKAHISLSSPAGHSVISRIEGIDPQTATISLDAATQDKNLPALLASNEITALAYLDQIKVQFDLDGLMLVTQPGLAEAAAFRAQMPSILYRFQRRQAFRVRPNTRTPQVRLPLPGQPEQALRLRILDLSLAQVCQLLPHFPTLPTGNPHGCWVSPKK